MRIIISPAKQMRVDTDTFACTEVPVFMEKTEILKEWIRSLSYDDFWGDDLYREVMDYPEEPASRRSRIIINLASKEYSKCIEKYLQTEDRYITCVFSELESGKVVQKGVYAKMARGEMVRFMAGIQAAEPEQIKDFNWSGYHFDEERSSDTEYVFIRKEVPGIRIKK